MCQINAFIRKEKKEELLRENVTSLKILDHGIQLNTLFEGLIDYKDLTLEQIDFSAGKIIFERNEAV